MVCSTQSPADRVPGPRKEERIGWLQGQLNRFADGDECEINQRLASHKGLRLGSIHSFAANNGPQNFCVPRFLGRYGQHVAIQQSEVGLLPGSD